MEMQEGNGILIYENTPTLTTKRLTLRKFSKDDIPSMFELLSDKEVNTFLPWQPLGSLQETEKFLEEKFFSSYKKQNGYRYAICLREEDVPIGYIGIGGSEKSCDLGYGLRREFWHQGITSEAAEAVLGRIKKAGYKYATATHDVLNPFSGGVMKKIGMEYKYSYEEVVLPKNETVTFRMYQINFDPNAETFMEYWNKSTKRFIEKL